VESSPTGIASVVCDRMDFAFGGNNVRGLKQGLMQSRGEPSWLDAARSVQFLSKVG